MARAKFEITIESDGKLTVTTGNLQGEQHLSAEQFMKELAIVMGGPVEVKSLQGHHHAHTHSEDHVQH